VNKNESVVRFILANLVVGNNYEQAQQVALAFITGNSAARAVMAGKPHSTIAAKLVGDISHPVTFSHDEYRWIPLGISLMIGRFLPEVHLPVVLGGPLSHEHAVVDRILREIFASLSKEEVQAIYDRIANVETARRLWQ